MVNALTGDSLGGMAFNSLVPTALALDPVLGLLYVVATTNGGYSSIVVLDPNTFATVGTIDIPDCQYCTENAVLMVDRPNNELLLVGLG